MSNYNEAADALKRMAVAYKNIVSVADLLEQVGSVENVMKEAQVAREAASKERDDVLADLKKAKESLKTASESAKRVENDANAYAKVAIMDANAMADKIVADAIAQATAVAKAQADAIIQSAVEKVTGSEDAFELSEKELAESQEKLVYVTGELEVKQKQLDALNASLESLKAKFV